MATSKAILRTQIKELNKMKYILIGIFIGVLFVILGASIGVNVFNTALLKMG